MTDTDIVERLYPQAEDLRSVAKIARETDQGDLADVIEGAAVTVEQLSSDLESATKALHTHSDAVIAQHRDITSLRAENERLREALKPFAEYARCHVLSSEYDIIASKHDGVGGWTQLVVGDLRRAAKALAGETG